MYQVITFGLLFLTWLVFSGLFDPFHLTLGVISSAMVTWVSSDLLFQNRTRGRSGLWREARLSVGYVVWLVREVTMANLHVLRLALHPKGMREVKPRVVRFKTTLRTDFAKWVLANSITLTPGTVTIKIDGDEFHVHAISEKAAAEPEVAMQRRIKAIFEPDP